MAARPSKRQCVYNYTNRWLNEWLNAFEAESCAGAVCASEEASSRWQNGPVRHTDGIVIGPTEEQIAATTWHSFHLDC
jgi:hypothetical protein